MPSYYSCSERVLEALALGSPVLTTPSAFFRDAFGDGLRYFADGAGLAALLDSPDDDATRDARLDQGRAQVLAGHTWDQRARTIVARIGGDS